MNDDADYRPIWIGDKVYLPMDFLTDPDDKKRAIPLVRLGCIMQRIKQLDLGGFVKPGYAVVTVLVPDDKIYEAQALGQSIPANWQIVDSATCLL